MYGRRRFCGRPSVCADPPPFAFEEIKSLENELTSGTFGNEFDNQFNAGADFGSYDQHFITGGLGGTLVEPKDKTITTNGSGTSGTFHFGYYMPWKMPMSFYGSFKAEGLTDYRTRNPATVEKVWDDNKHGKLKTEKKTSYYMKPLFKKSDMRFQYLIGAGAGMNLVTGVQFAYRTDRSNWDKTNNIKTVYKDHEDNDNNKTTYLKNIASTHTLISAGINATNAFPSIQSAAAAAAAESKDFFILRVPVAFSTGSLNHVAAFHLGSEITHNNGRYYYKTPKDSEEITAKITDITAKTTLKGEYAVEIPAADRDGDSWEVGGALGLTFNSAENRWKYNKKHKDSDQIVKASYKSTPAPGIGLILEASGARMLKFASPKQSVRFNMKPSLGFELDTHMDGTGTQNMSGSAKVGSKKYSYTKKAVGNQYKNETVFKTTASVPMGLKILPENWKVGFLFGATPSVKHTVTTKWDRSKKHKLFGKITTDNDGTTTTTDYKDYLDNTYTSGSTGKTYKWEITEKHEIGLTVPFEGGAHLDIAIEGKDIWQFGNLKVQAFIPLGRGKKAASAE